VSVDGDVYLATSEIQPHIPSKRGFNFNELTKLMQDSGSTRIVAILDCCYSGSAKVSKGHEDDAAKLGTYAIDRQSSKEHPKLLRNIVQKSVVKYFDNSVYEEVLNREEHSREYIEGLVRNKLVDIL
jgi:hypothetical protein